MIFHGTGVAGLIASKPNLDAKYPYPGGIANNANLVFYKVLRENNHFETIDVLAALNEIASTHNDLDTTNDIDIVNLSLRIQNEKTTSNPIIIGAIESSLLEKFNSKNLKGWCDYLYHNKGILIVSGVGNDIGNQNVKEDTVGYPAKYD